MDEQLRASMAELIAKEPEHTCNPGLRALRAAAAEGFSQDSITRALDYADEAHICADERWAAALVILRLYASRDIESGLAFWAACPVPALTAAFRMIRETIPPDFGTVLSNVNFLSARTTADARRRIFFALRKIYEQEYWPNHLYIDSITTDKWRFLLLGRLFASHPENIGNAASLLLGAAKPEVAPAALVARIIAHAQERIAGNPLQHWGAVHVADILIRNGEPELAMRILRSACSADLDKSLRFEMLRQMALAQMQSPLEGLTQLRCLVTALRVYPDHVRSHELLSQILKVLGRSPATRTTYEPAEFAAGNADLLIMDGRIDVAISLQVREQIPEFMREAELAALDPRAPRGITNCEMLIPAEPVMLPGFAGGGELQEGLDPWVYATQPGNNITDRRLVQRMTLKDVYFSYSANAAFYMDTWGNPVPAMSFGHAGFFTRQFIAERETEVIPGECFDLTVPYGHSNYAHFLLDRAPRLIFAPQASSDVTLLVDAESLSWTEQLLAILGLEYRLRPIHRDRLHFSEQLTVMSHAQHPAQLGYRPYMEFLRGLAKSTAPAGRRIFVHRDQRNRGIHNEASFYVTLERHGFEFVRLERLSFAAQIELFAQAECVAGVHGAGLANVVFCAPGTKVIEILPLTYSTPAYLIVSARSGLKYLPYIEPGARNLALATNQQFSDTEINIERWTGFLQRCLA